MITQKQIGSARKAWLQASKILNFKIFTPYFLEINGIKKEIFAFLPEYGSPNGMIIGLASQYEDKDIRNWITEHSCYCSFIYVESHLVYDENIFKNALEDWGKFTLLSVVSTTSSKKQSPSFAKENVIINKQKTKAHEK